MSTTPPRRSRPKPPSGGSSLPFLPIFIGVVVLGFVIGAGLSVMGRHGSSDTVAMATSSPFGEASDAGQATAVPTPIPAAPRKAPVTPALSEAPAPSPHASPSAHASPRASAAATSTPSAHPQATKRAVAQANAVKTTSAPVPQPSATTQQTNVSATAAPTHKPETAAPAAPSTAPTSIATAPPATAAPAPAAAVVDADGTFPTLAGNVVKQYLLSISRGDTDSAYAALGEGPGSHAGSVPEIGAVDSTLHIGKIQSRGSDTSATVNVDLTTSSGPYYGQYTVHKSATGAAIIVSHTFGKP